MVDALFASPRLAEVYDPLDADRGDLDAYVAMVEEVGAASVVDLGCGPPPWFAMVGTRSGHCGALPSIQLFEQSFERRFQFVRVPQAADGPRQLDD